MAQLGKSGGRGYWDKLMAKTTGVLWARDSWDDPLNWLKKLFFWSYFHDPRDFPRLNLILQRDFPRRNISGLTVSDYYKDFVRFSDFPSICMQFLLLRACQWFGSKISGVSIANWRCLSLWVWHYLTNRCRLFTHVMLELYNKTVLYSSMLYFTRHYAIC